MTWGKHRLPRLLIAAIICVCAVSAVCPSYASSEKPKDRTVIKYVPLSTLTGDAYPDSITVTAGSKTVTIKAKYNRAKKLSNNKAYGESTDYSCAAMVKKFYRAAFGIEVYNLNKGCVPLVQSNKRSFVKVMDNPRVGDIARFEDIPHWAIVKSCSSKGVR